jgi:hypothetical protein
MEAYSCAGVSTAQTLFLVFRRRFPDGLFEVIGQVRLIKVAQLLCKRSQ